jgi:integrase
VAGQNPARAFRRHLAAAGVDRAELFEKTDLRAPIRLHDLRATFVTLSLAHGATETWVATERGTAPA